MKPRTAPPRDDGPVDDQAETLLRSGSGARPKGAPDDEPPLTQRFARVSGEGSASHPAVVDVRDRPLEEQAFDQRYRTDRILGQGGMGEVWRCQDDRIGRDVAMKVIHPGHGSRSDLRARFEREARIQGQLEHPSIVPVYDLGVRPDGAAFFTMKRIVGRTLEEIIAGLRGGDPEVQATYSRRKLLAAFTSACQAVAFAHQRGVIHRDLKPSNVILGPFGEIYVLDWGVAKVLDTADGLAPSAVVVRGADAPSSGGLAAAPSSLADGAADPEAATVLASEPGSEGGARGSDATEAGTLLGTPGYMAPEQAAGEIDAIDERTDVYALGAILFELLTLTPLHEGRTADELIASTLSGAEARAEERGLAAVPPELEAACVRATALVPADRYGSVRELHDEVEHYLDGDRDLQRRRAMSRDYEQNAQRVLEAGRHDPAKHLRARTEAIAELNKALALDPANESALAALVQVLMDSPEALPPDAEAEFQRVRHRDQARAAKAGAIAFLCLFLMDPLMAWMGIRSPGLMWAGLPLVAGTTAALLWASRSRCLEARHFYVIATLVAGIASWTSLIFGPYVIVPGAVLGFAAPIAVTLRANLRQRIYLMVSGALAVAIPLAAQQLGWLPPSYEFREGLIAILPVTVDFPPIPSQLYLMGSTLLIIVAPLYVIGGAIDRLVRAERHLFAQAWNLRELMPAAARDEAGARLVDPPEPSNRCPMP